MVLAKNAHGYWRFVFIKKVKAMWWQPQGSVRLCKRTRKDTHEAERAVGDNGAKEKLMSGVSDDIRRKVLQAEGL